MPEEYTSWPGEAPAEPTPTPTDLWEYDNLDGLLAEAATHPERDDG
jgi:hypothetical protein